MNKTAVALLALSFSGVASATPTTSLSAQQILEQFNLVALGSVKSSSHVDGRSYIGGSVSGGDYAQHPENMANSAYAGLTVAGAASNLHVNSNGAVIGGSLSGSTIQGGGSAAVLGSAAWNNFNVAAYVAGSESGNNFNGGHLDSAPATVAAAGSTDFATTLGDLSTSLSLLASTGSSVTTNGYGRATFNAVANADGLAVFDLTALDTLVFSQSEFEFKLNGASTVIINIDEANLKTSANFLGGSAQTLASNVIWNFYNATELTLNNQFGGTVLATSAHLTNGNNIEGAVLVDTLTQNGEIHAGHFTGDVTTVSTVPEPETLPLMLGGLLLVAGFARRRRS